MKRVRGLPRTSSALVFVLVLAFARVASAAEDVAPTKSEAPTPAPLLAWTYGAHGLPSGAFGAFAQGVGAADTRDARIGGGVTAWGAPIERLTIVADASRDVRGPFTPSVAALVRLAGDAHRGFALSLLGKYKVDGFAEGPRGELESELESGVLVGYAQGGFHADVNAIAGAGLGDDGEVDVEGRARVGYDVTDRVRVGVDGVTRARVGGDRRLPGDRTWDFAVGPQLLLAFRPAFVALTAGPTTTSTTTPLAWTTFLSIGVAAF